MKLYYIYGDFPPFIDQRNKVFDFKIAKYGTAYCFVYALVLDINLDI